MEIEREGRGSGEEGRGFSPAVTSRYWVVWTEIKCRFPAGLKPRPFSLSRKR
jgi:hypothetical protein